MGVAAKRVASDSDFSKGGVLAEKGTPEFYRQEAERLTKLANEVTSSSVRLELLEIAAGFQRLAAFAVSAANRNPPESPNLPKSKSA